MLGNSEQDFTRQRGADEFSAHSLAQHRCCLMCLVIVAYK